MSISADNDRLTVIIPKSLKKELKELADIENRSISNYVVNLLEIHVRDLKDVTVVQAVGRGERLVRDAEREYPKHPVRDNKFRIIRKEH